MATFVLVPGAWLGAWAWGLVTPRLRAAGHDVHPLTLTGGGDRAHLGSPETDLDTHVQDVVAAVEVEELRDVVLVGHSYAGAVVTIAADRLGDRLERLVYVAGALPEDGHALVDAGGPELRAAFEDLAATRGGGWRLPVADDAELAAYYGDHGLAGARLAWFRRHAVGHPLAASFQVARVGGGAAALPRVYVHCTHDLAPPPVRDGEDGWRVVELDAGHWPMITRPEALAELLDGLAG